MGLKSIAAQLKEPQTLKRGYLSLWVALAVWSFLKGLGPRVQGWGSYLWLIDYHEGLIKRGLIGTLIHSLGYTLRNTDWDRMQTLILMLHLLTALFAIALLVKFQLKSFLNREDLPTRQAAILLSACWLIFACTQFWPTIAYISGYVDIYILFAYIGAFYLFSRKQYISGAIAGCAAVLVHEAFVFLWANILAVFVLVPLLESRRLDRKLFVLSLLPLLTLLLLLMLHNQAGLIAEIRAVPNAIIDPVMKDALINAQFGQTVRSATQIMIDIWKTNTARGLAAFLYYTSPAIVMILAVPLMLEKQRHLMIKTVLIILIASYLPLTILLIAWDLSRFLVWANLTTVLTLTYISTRALNRSALEESL